jgi:hypothetical protein
MVEIRANTCLVKSFLVLLFEAPGSITIVIAKQCGRVEFD